jgi:multidrug resistance protein, MATE family
MNNSIARQDCPTASPQVGRGGSSREIWRLTWPQMLMMLVHFFIGFVDVLVAGRIGTGVQASLGMITQSLMFFLIIAMAVANGGVASVSQSLGACLHKRARRYVGLMLLLALGLGGCVALAGFALRGTLLDLLRAPAEIRPVTEYFLGVYLLVLPGYYVLVVSNAVFRAHKWVYLPLFAMSLVTVVNTILDFGLGLGMWGMPNLGYQGVAWATFFSVSAGALFNLFLLRRLGLLERGAFPPWRWSRVAWRYLFKVAWPAGTMQVLWHTAYLVLFAVVASLPVERIHALAGMTAGLRVEAILFMPGFAFNLTASILVGHFIGAGDTVGAKRTGYRILGLGVACISLLGLLLWQFVEPIAVLLSSDPAVQFQIRDYLFYNILAIPFTVCNMILGGVMVGAGATFYNLCIFGVSAWLVRLPLAWLLGHVLWEAPTGVWVAMLVSQAVQALVMLYFFQFRPWHRFGMRRRAPAVSSMATVVDKGVLRT